MRKRGLQLGNRCVPREDVIDRAERAASGLAAAGVGQGDVVAIYLRNDFAFVEATLAAGMLGAYPTPVNWHNSADEAAYIFQDSGAKAVVIHADLYHAVAHVIPENVAVLVVETPPEIISAYKVDPAACALPSARETWNALIERHQPRSAPPAAAPGTMIYTSGTTGHPKGVRRLPPRPDQAPVLIALSSLIFGWRDEKPEDVVTVVTGPMYHAAPNAYAQSLFNAGAMVFLEPRFDAEGLLRLIERERVTHIHMVPTMFVRLLKLPEGVRHKYDLSSLRFVTHAAAPCPAHVKHAMIEWWGPIIHEYYGATETNAVVYCNTEEWLAHPGTVGRPILGAIVRILDTDGVELPTGQIGDVYCRLANHTDFTYHGDDAKRARAEKHGIISLGDVGYLDEDGYLYLCDRSKDMIISGGANIYPAEIEAQLMKAPGVFDCAVFGIPDDEFGERVHAVVLPAEGAALKEADLREFLRARMASYKVPKAIDFVDNLPREDSGKIFKRKLRQPFWEDAGRKI